MTDDSLRKSSQLSLKSRQRKLTAMLCSFRWIVVLPSLLVWEQRDFQSSCAISRRKAHVVFARARPSVSRTAVPPCNSCCRLSLVLYLLLLIYAVSDQVYHLLFVCYCSNVHALHAKICSSVSTHQSTLSVTAQSNRGELDHFFLSKFTKRSIRSLASPYLNTLASRPSRHWIRWIAVSQDPATAKLLQQTI